MAYAGYLIKVGTYTIPLSIIRAETYSPYKSVTDLDSYVDANGELHRNALEHVAYKIEFETIPLLTDVQFGDLMGNLYAQMSNQLERKAEVTAYIPEINDYITQDMYMPDIKPVLYYADGEKVQYNQIRLAFIGY
ncbi:MAG: hypothetical protein IKW90_01685 [Lachnospiraceae bacterium]|nr:hypothetical protein [Lachnospiraceae bacterium]